MPHLLDLPWLWFFGALSLGIFVGWIGYRLTATRWNDRVARIAFGAVAVGVLLMIATILPARYGDRLALGLVVSVVGPIGCYLLATSRWNDRPLDIGIGAVVVGGLLAIAKVVPVRYGHPLEFAVILAVVGAIGCFVGWALRDLAEFVPTSSAAVTSGAATGSSLYRDVFAGVGGSAPDMRATTGYPGSAQAPTRGGYTFPETRPFADATTSQAQYAEPARRTRRHWTSPT